MKTAFFGTTEFAVTVLERLLAGDSAPSLVVTPPPSRSGRGRKLKPSAVADLARSRGLPLIESSDVGDPVMVEAVDQLDPEIVIVCAFGQMIGPELLSGRSFLNVHPSLVPRWRGAAPIERALLAGDEVTGVSIMEMTEGLDDGPVLGAVEVPIAARETYETLAERLAESSGDLLETVLERLGVGDLDAEPQDGSVATYAEKIDPSERRLDPDSSADQLDRQVRTLGSRLGTYLAFGPGGDQRLGVVACRPLERDLGVARAPGRGELLAVEDLLLLGCAGGVLEIDRVKPPGGKEMLVADYLRGHEPPREVV